MGDQSSKNIEENKNTGAKMKKRKREEEIKTGTEYITTDKKRKTLEESNQKLDESKKKEHVEEAEKKKNKNHDKAEVKKNETLWKEKVEVGKEMTKITTHTAAPNEKSEREKNVHKTFEKQQEKKAMSDIENTKVTKKHGKKRRKDRPIKQKY